MGKVVQAIVLGMLLAVTAHAQLQPTKAGVLFTATDLTDAGPTQSSRYIATSGWRQCVFQCLITDGTVTSIQIQHRVAGSSGDNEWTDVAGAECSADGEKETVTSPLGEYAVEYTGATDLDAQVIYECDKALVN